LYYNKKAIQTTKKEIFNNMKNTLTRFKKITAITAVFALLLVQNFALVVGLGLFKDNNKIDTVNAVYNSSEITVSNSNFENPNSSNYPITPNSWSKIDSDEAVTAGLIDLSPTTYDEHKEEDYKLDFNNPGKAETVDKDENKVLMINAQETSTKMGYQSSSFSLAKGGFYTIEVLVYTQNFGGITSAASLYLTGDQEVEESENSKILAINTAGTWKSYKFFVQTSSIADKNLNLELYLGSKTAFTSQGAVFFDDVKIQSHSHDRYFSEINDLGLTQDNYKILNLQEQKVEDAVVNANFEETVNDPETNNIGWEVITANNSVADSEYAINGIFNIDENFNATLTGVEDSPTDANIYENTKALLINNINPASIGFKSSDILIEQHKLYRLSLWSKTSNIDGGATIKLIQQNPYGEDNTTYTPATSSITSVNTSSYTNEKYENWSQYSFLIKGSVFLDSYANLELWVGTEEQAEVGYAFFDNIELFELTTTQFNAISANDKNKQIDFSNLSGTSEVSNSNFNKVIIEDLDDSYPYAPESWTNGSNSTNFETANIESGVINTNTAQFNTNSANYGFANPGNLNNQINDEISNNVLVIGNVDATSQYYTSSSKSLTADSYYKLSFNLQTQGLASNNVLVRVLNNTTPVITLNNLASDLAWSEYSVYIKTGALNFDATIKLMLGTPNNEISGYAFFDNVTISTSTNEQFNTASEATSQNTSAVDLSSENFNAVSENTTNGLYSPLNFTGEKLSSEVTDEFIQAGVLDTQNFDSQNFVGFDNPNSANENNSNVLMIGATTDAHYTYTSDLSYKVTASEYYKLSVFVKTSGLSQLSENLQLDENDNPIEYGASLALTGFSEKFNAINSQLESVNNEYLEYVFYINSNADKDFSVVLGLGSEDALTKGYAFFSNITFEKIDEETYEESTLTLTSENPPTNIINLQNVEAEDEEEEDEEEQTPEGMDFDFLLFPTLLLGIALLVAIIGYSIRQIKFNKIIRKRIKTEIYDRNRTVAVDHERREVVKQRQERLAKLKEQLAQIQTEIEENEQAFKQSKQEIKELKDDELDEKETKGLTEKQLKVYKDKKKQALKKQRQAAYIEKRERLQREFDKIEKEIEKLEREERLMFEKYRNYRAQVKAIKLEIKEKQKQARIKQKLKKQKAKEKKKQEKLKK
jgi:hypothetical protein